MLAVAQRANGGGTASDANPRWLHAPADALTLPDRSVDLIVSSFVYQLVPDRRTAFAEAYRVLRAGGRIALVTWLDRGPDFEPAIEFDEAMFDLEIEEPEEAEEERRAGDFRSPRSAARELRDAGLKRVSAEAEILEYRWSIDSYLDFKEHYEERELFSWLDTDRAARLLTRARERLEELPVEALTWRAELVSAAGQRPG
jgi:SAM-dependent methyltransferase